ncbi:hypothetical protein [Nocardioides sp. URHA0020]|uniref:hypothetical protein n=1 Tax=Nocardioides sp. URHA0020 TaxID=1380392 RepID=UPI000490AECC|nr:hypothetical protein [Nocardioides sp. URHA0020]
MPDQPHDDDFDLGRDAEAHLAADELAWQSIIANYGERAQIDEPPPVAPPVAPVSDAPFGGRFGDPRALEGYDEEPEVPVDDDVEEGYVPPEPPPLPRLSPDRALAWAGVFGSPLVLLLALILSLSIPTWLGYLLVVGFVGGFIYLVVQMPREPRDPWDDGAQI